jgi:hypothetical protein
LPEDTFACSSDNTIRFQARTDVQACNRVSDPTGPNRNEQARGEWHACLPCANGDTWNALVLHSEWGKGDKIYLVDADFSSSPSLSEEDEANPASSMAAENNFVCLRSRFVQMMDFS